MLNYMWYLYKHQHIHSSYSKCTLQIIHKIIKCRLGNTLPNCKFDFYKAYSASLPYCEVDYFCLIDVICITMYSTY